MDQVWLFLHVQLCVMITAWQTVGTFPEEEGQGLSEGLSMLTEQEELLEDGGSES